MAEVAKITERRASKALRGLQPNGDGGCMLFSRPGRTAQMEGKGEQGLNLRSGVVASELSRPGLEMCDDTIAIGDKLIILRCLGSDLFDRRGFQAAFECIATLFRAVARRKTLFYCDETAHTSSIILPLQSRDVLGYMTWRADPFHIRVAKDNSLHVVSDIGKT